MPEKPSTAFESFQEKYANVFAYENVLRRHTDKDGHATGDVKDLTKLFVSESQKDAEKNDKVPESFEDDLKKNAGKLQELYMQGERERFLAPAKKHYSESVDAFETFGKDNLEGIIDSTDTGILKGAVLPYVLEKYNVDNPQYKGLQKLLSEVRSMAKKMEELKNPETREEAVGKLVQEKKQYYAEAYKDNEFFRELFSSLVYEESEVNAFAEKYKAKSKELDEALEGDIQGFIKAAKITPEDFTKIYASIFNQQYEEASKKKK